MRSTIFAFLFTLAAGLGYVASQQNYVAEVLFVVDKNVKDKYIQFGYDNVRADTEMQGDVNYFVNQINSYYATLQQAGLHLEIRPSQVIYLNEAMYEECKLTDKGTSLNADLGLKVFKEWLGDNQNLVVNPYDIAIAFTGYDIYGSSPSVSGYATVGAACNHNGNTNVGIVEYSGAEDTAITAAHEIAHSLGSNHDPSSCSTGQYIMAPSLYYSNQNKRSFSDCTKDGIAEYIQSLDADNCLTQTTTQAANFDIKSQSGRDIIDPEKICQRKLGRPDVYVCRGSSLYTNIGGDEDGFCLSMFCAVKGTMGCSSVTGSNGMKCAADKRCSGNKCLPAPEDFPTESAGSNGCEYPDDDSGNVYGYSSCQELVSLAGASNCQNDDIRARCCETCAGLYTGIEGCLYGESPQCAPYADIPNSLCTSQGNIQICCQTCQGYSARRRRAAGEPSIEITGPKQEVDLEKGQQRIKDEDEKKTPKVEV